MNAKLLDRELHRLTNSEALYLKGIKPDYERFKKVNRGGVKRYVMSCERGKNAIFPFQFHPQIMISRHQRYMPVETHTHEWIEMCYVYSGSVNQVINETTPIHLEKGQILLLDSDSVHSIGDTSDEDILINILIEKAYFNNAFFNRFSKENVLLKFLLNSISEKKIHDNYIVFSSENNSRIQMFMQELMIEFMEPPKESSEDFINNLINLLFLELVNVYRSEGISSELKLGKSNTLSIMKYIEANYLTCSLTSVAELFNLNPNYLSTMLKKNTGCTFKELVQHYRFSYVITRLCNTEESVDQIIFNAGYENTTYFYKKFKEIYGSTPKQYREEHSRKENRVWQ